MPFSTHRDNQRVLAINVAWVSTAVATFLSVPLAAIWALATTPAGAPAGYVTAALVFAAAALLEALAEPFAAPALHAQQYSTRLRVESLAAVARCVLSYALVALVPPARLSPLVGLALGQLCFGALLLAGYALAAIRSGTAALPTRKAANGKALLTGELWKLLGAYEWQAAQKVVLQEGEKLVLAVSGTMAAVSADVAAVYSVANNLASLVVRLALLPVEEVCFAAFGRLAAEGSAQTARQLLRTVLRGVTLVGLCFVAFGPGYARLVIQLLYGTKYSSTDAPTVLAWCCAYVFLLAVNGTTEAFVHSVATESQLRRGNALLVVFSALYVAASAILLRVSSRAAVGLVLANCASLCDTLCWRQSHFFHACFACALGPLNRHDAEDRVQLYVHRALAGQQQAPSKQERRARVALEHCAKRACSGRTRVRSGRRLALCKSRAERLCAHCGWRRTVLLRGAHSVCILVPESGHASSSKTSDDNKAQKLHRWRTERERMGLADLVGKLKKK